MAYTVFVQSAHRKPLEGKIAWVQIVPPEMILGLSAIICFDIVNWSEYALK